MNDSTTDRVGRYQLLEPIGTGPCGTVSRAKVFGVAGFERQFAIKRFHPELTITTALAQSLSVAARSYGSLEHPRIARMSEFGVAQGQTFTAVELVAGLDAARLIAEVRLAGSTLGAGGALALVSQAARAVGYAHGRGLAHLGLAPTNVIITADGDVKITDFAILSAGLPQRPVDVARLQQRIPYLAPEQVAHEATSAATDVFALGVIAYELVTGQRTFRGDTPQQIAQAILDGPPPEPPLPRPIVRVLHRCLARSPFERFPDARALADALDAALRVAPVPGTRKDVGVQVAETLARLASLHDSEMSGMVALHVGTGPVPRQPAAAIASELPTSEFVRPDVPVPGPAPLVGPATTMPDLPRAMTTMTGLAPPPIPVPPGIGAPATTPPPPAGSASTLLGIATLKAPPSIPSIPSQPPRPQPPAPPRAASASVPALPRPPDGPRPPRTPSSPPPPIASAPIASTPGAPAATPPAPVATSPSPRPLARIQVGPPQPRVEAPPPAALQIEELFAGETDAGMSDLDIPTGEISTIQLQKLNAAASRRSSEMDRITESAPEPELEFDLLSEPATPPEPATPTPAVAPPPTMTTRPGMPPPAPPRTTVPAIAEAGIATQGMRRPELKRSRTPLIVAAVLLGGGGLAVGGWQLYGARADDRDPAGAETKPVASASADASTAIAQGSDAAPAGTAPDATVATTADAAAVPVDPQPADAQLAVAPADAAAVPVDPQPTGGDTLSITSTPAGARVYVDGADTGVTPLELPASPDRHTIALILPGHDLYIAQVDGSGTFAIPMKEVTPSGGAAGIKVIRCKDKDRYYVFVDGKPTGQLCPTERIDASLGPHTVEIYDAVSETRKKWDIVIKDTRLSHRVKIE